MTDDALANRVERAQLLLDAQRYEEAIQESGKALAESPDLYPAQILLARALFGANRHVDALREAERAIELEPQNASAHCLIAQVAIHLHRIDRADRATAEACRLAPWWAWAHYLRMRVLLRIRNVAAAKEEAALVLALDPDGSLGHVAQGEIAIHLQAWSEAEKAYHRALERNPQSSNALLNYGFALSQQGKDVAAIDAYTEAGKLDPRSSIAAQNIVAASQRHLSFTTARGSWRGAVRLLWLVGWYVFGVLLAESLWLWASALGVVLLVGLVILLVMPYRRLKNLPEPARSLLDSARFGSGHGTWSRRFGAHPLAAPALLVTLAILAGVIGYAGVDDQHSNESGRQQITAVSHERSAR